MPTSNGVIDTGRDKRGTAILTRIRSIVSGGVAQYRVAVELHFDHCVFEQGQLLLRHEHIPADLQNVRLTAGSFRTITDAFGQAALAIQSVGNSEPSRFTLAFETTWQPASRTTLPWLPWFVLPDFAPDAAVSAAVAQAEVAVNEDLPDLSRFSLTDSFGRVIQVGLFRLS